MKKIMISLLLVLLTICLFVSCIIGGPTEEDNLPQSISFAGEIAYGSSTFVFNKIVGKNGSGTHTPNIGDPKNFSYEFSSTEGLKVTYENATTDVFYKDNQSTKITSYKELSSLSSIYIYVGSWYALTTPQSN